MKSNIISLKGVSRVYHLGDEAVHALDNVNFTVKAGDYVTITGPSGSGKSTLINMIGGVDSPSTGTVEVSNKNLSHMSDDELSDYRNSHIGFVFQSFNLQSSATVLENVSLPLVFAGVPPEARKKRALECLEIVGLHNRHNHKPSQLSSGQQQLTAIARALVTKPKILIADEPTGNLDSVHGGQIWQVLQDINNTGTALLVVTHDANMAHLAKRIVDMRDGKLTELAG